MKIHKTKQGTYRCRWTVKGKDFQKTFKDKYSANEFKAKFDLGLTSKEPSAKTFEQFSKEYINNYLRIQTAASSAIELEGVINRYFLPRLGEMRLSDITPKVVEWCRSEIKQHHNVGNKTINDAMSALSRMFTLAITWDYVMVNPCIKVGKLKVQKNEMDFWSEDEVHRVLSWCREYDLPGHDLIVLQVCAGLRIGEVRGLMRDCIHLSSKQFTVKRTWCQKEGQIVPRTKGVKSRRLPMTPEVYEVLKRRSLIPMNHPVFTFTEVNGWYKRRFPKLASKVGVHRIRVHDLRHTFGAMCALKGIDSFRIMKMMGHADIKQTQQYMHLSPDNVMGIEEGLFSPPSINRQIINPTSVTI